MTVVAIWELPMGEMARVAIRGRARTMNGDRLSKRDVQESVSRESKSTPPSTHDSCGVS